MSTELILTIQNVTRQVTIYLGFPIFILGVIGGLLNVLVFLSLKTFRQNSCSFYLTIMAVVSVGYLVTGLLTFLVMYGFGIDWTKQSRFYCIFREGFVHISMLIALTCLCLATIDQFLATSSSVRLQQWCNIKLARRLCLLFTIVWFLYGIAFFTSHDLVYFPSVAEWDCTVINIIFQQYFNAFHVLVLLCGLPLVLTVLFGLLAYRNVKQLSYRTVPLVRRELDKQLTVMVLVQVVYNVFALLPYFIINIIITSPFNPTNPLTQTIITSIRIISIIFLYSCYAVRSQTLHFYLNSSSKTKNISVFRVPSTSIYVLQSDFEIN